MGSVCELESAGHSVSTTDQKRVLLKGLLREYDVTVESVMGSDYTYPETVARLIVREARL